MSEHTSDDIPASSEAVARRSEVASNMLRYWEPRRLIYNGVLVAVVGLRFLVNAPQSWEVVSFQALLLLFALAVVANVLYCAAYVVDWFVQQSEFKDAWLGTRWMVLALGTAFAAVLTYFITLGVPGP